MSLCRDDFDVVHANAAQFGGNKFRCLLHVAFVFFEGADARDAEKSLQLVEKSRLIAAGKIDCGRSHGL
jgi:hypothetical protein